MNKSAAVSQSRPKVQAPPWHATFLQMLPQIQQSASFPFRHLAPEARQEAIQEVTAAALIAFVRLVELGRANLAYPTVLARYGIAHYRRGRRVSSRLNIRDVLSPYAQHQKRFRVNHLHRFSRKDGQWREMLVEDKKASPADLAAIRIDFADWLKTLSRRQRQFVKLLATGVSTNAAARKCRVTPGRISQIRRQLKESWNSFQGEVTTSIPPATFTRRDRDA